MNTFLILCCNTTFLFLKKNYKTNIYIAMFIQLNGKSRYPYLRFVKSLFEKIADSLKSYHLIGIKGCFYKAVFVIISPLCYRVLHIVNIIKIFLFFIFLVRETIRHVNKRASRTQNRCIVII